jgi:hypothetical protein
MTREEDRAATMPSSRLLEAGTYKKTEFCPKSYRVVREGDRICGRRISAREGGDMALDVRKTLEDCLEPGGDYLVETKYNGHRGVLEYSGGKAALFSDAGPNQKPLPAAAASLAAAYLSGGLPSSPSFPVESATLDGEMLLENCFLEGLRTVPEVPVQLSAVKGDHPRLRESCDFGLKVFDLLEMNGRDLTALPLLERKAELARVLPKAVRGRGEGGGSIFLEPVESEVTSDLDEIHALFCDATGRGHEGLVLKDPRQDYEWRGRKTPARSGWKKIKEEFSVNAAVTGACLGNWHRGTKTNLHLARYKDLELSVCKDEGCRETVVIGRAGLNTQGGAISGWRDWNIEIHYPLLELLKGETANPVDKGVPKSKLGRAGTPFRSLTDIKQGVRRGWKGWNKLEGWMGFKELEKMMGCSEDMEGCYRGAGGEVGLPACISVPAGEMVVEVVTTEINRTGGEPHLGGPPRVLRVRGDRSAPDTMERLRDLYALEVGGWDGRR